MNKLTTRFKIGSDTSEVLQRHISLKAIAEHYGPVSYDTVIRAVRNAQITIYKIGNTPLIKLKDLKLLVTKLKGHNDGNKAQVRPHSVAAGEKGR